MVIGAFPAAKLGALLLRQISKPIATVVKENAKKFARIQKIRLYASSSLLQLVRDQAENVDTESRQAREHPPC
ncbi:hypothetical protein NQ318_005177 [Aromia moschata]|uniref:Uncharacterized protein n=1 Tax=Aromia moschata TaxID=1265417 RepID=A0AAV8XJ98_9CUCU|nr:hypothetical protein NQ318_005177 [Aromia moschata]